ncbi:MAG: type II toxin-antitoxin system RelE/ParE family toxin [Propionibacteriaceae bacterium]|jgi:plasmid stabilization system protein ParE|nr:type II toxin-antitoxin system RelE/ParE family toxin [Propionibacteriaceae bacterium]
MRYRLSTHPGAAADFRDSLAYFRDIDPRLASAVRVKADEALRFIRQYPYAGPSAFGDYRYVVFGQYRHKAIYRIVGNTIRILAIVHTSRDPKWIRQLVEYRNQLD